MRQTLEIFHTTLFEHILNTHISHLLVPEATSKTWTETPEPELSGPWKIWALKNLEPENPVLKKSWSLKNLDPEKSGLL